MGECSHQSQQSPRSQSHFQPLRRGTRYSQLTGQAKYALSQLTMTNADDTELFLIKDITGLGSDNKVAVVSFGRDLLPDLSLKRFEKLLGIGQN